MPIQAQWHDITLETGSRFIKTFKSLDTEIGLDFERNDDTEGEPATQTVRRKLQKITFSYDALASLGVWPKLEFEGWTWQLAHGIHAPFYINGQSFMDREFIVTNCKMSSQVIDNQGRIIYAQIDVEMEEYAEEPSGLKIDKGIDIGFTPGIQAYQSDELDRALRTRASENDRQLTLRALDTASQWQ